MSDELRTNSNGIRLRRCCECACLVAFNDFSPSTGGFASETYWCRMKSKRIEDPEGIVCDAFCDAVRFANGFRLKGDCMCSECPNFFTQEVGTMVDGIWRRISVNGCSARRGKQIRYPRMFRACDEEIEGDTSTYRVTFVAYQTVEVEAEDMSEAERLAWDECELPNAEIDDIEEVVRMCMGPCSQLQLSDVQFLLESIGSGTVRDMDVEGAHSYLVIRFSPTSPPRIRLMTLDLVSVRVGEPKTVLFGGNCIVAWDVSKEQYANIGSNLARYVSSDGIIDIEWCEKKVNIREECDHCIHQSPFSGCIHPDGWVWDYEGRQSHCPHFEEENR